jgi:hypothetical protein
MQYNSITTLNEIRAAGPCDDVWEELLKHLGKTRADDEPLHLMTILESNGFDDATWCLRAASLDQLSRHFQAWCADQVLHLYEAEHPNDARVRDQIAMLRNDDASPEERAATRAAAWAAAWAARAFARSAAWSAACAATGDAAWAAAGVARDAALDAQEQQLRKMISQMD